MTIRLWIIPAILLLGCGLPGNTQERLKQTIEKFETAKQQAKEQYDEYQNVLHTASIDDISQEGLRETLRASASETDIAVSFRVAKKTMGDAQSCVDELKELKKLNRSRDTELARSLIVKCNRLMDRAVDIAGDPRKKLDLWLSSIRSAKDRVAAAKRQHQQLHNSLLTELGPESKLAHTVAERVEWFANKADDIKKRIDGLIAHAQHADKALATIEEQHKLLRFERVGSGGRGEVFNIGIFQAALDAVATHNRAVTDGIKDLRRRMEQLRNSRAQIVMELKRVPIWEIYYLYYDDEDDRIRHKDHWSACNYTSGAWGREALCKSKLTERTWATKSSGRGWGNRINTSWGNYMVPSDRRVRYQYFIRIDEFENGEVVKRGSLKAISATEFGHHAQAAIALDKRFPNLGVLQKEYASTRRQEAAGWSGSIPSGMHSKTRLVFMQSGNGEYDDDATGIHAPYGFPIAYVGNAAFGHWQGEGQNRVWRFTTYPFMSNHYWRHVVFGGKEPSSFKITWDDFQWYRKVLGSKARNIKNN